MLKQQQQQQQQQQQVPTFAQKRDQECRSLESIVSPKDKQHQETHDTLAKHLQFYEEEEQSTQRNAKSPAQTGMSGQRTNGQRRK